MAETQPGDLARAEWRKSSYSRGTTDNCVEVTFLSDAVEEAYIYGSWAARYSGEPGRVPKDVDVLVVGAVDEDDLYDAARAAERQLGGEVGIRRLGRDDWEPPADDPFLETVRSRPLVRLKIEKEDRR